MHRKVRFIKKIHRKAMDFLAEGVGFKPTYLSANGFQEL
jgi:hypothetical protein